VFMWAFDLLELNGQDALRGGNGAGR
jgi:hypothetical protein